MLTTIGMRKRVSRCMCMGLLLTMAPLASGCYGRFPVTHAVYRFNGDVTSNKLVHSLVMWGLIIIPVYKIAMIGDIFIFNLVEFWTGDTLDIGYQIESDGNQIALTSSEDGSEAILTVSRNGKLLSEQRMTKVSDTAFEMRDVTGTLTGTIVKDPSGSMHLMDREGRMMRTLAKDDLASLAVSPVVQ